MTTETQELPAPANTAVVANPSTALVDGQILTARVVKPYLKAGKLVGAVLSFDGKSETALLHIRQMSGEKPEERLAEMTVGDSLLVRIIVQQNGSKRKDVWATEKGVELALIVDMLNTNPDAFRGLQGRIHSVTEWGTFIELLDGAAKGHRGLLRPSSLAAGGRVKLGTFLVFKPGDYVEVDVAEARMDKEKLLIRLDNVKQRKAA